jgi:hypothetical protein
VTRTPIDRGFAFIKINTDGTSDVTVATKIGARSTAEEIISVHYNRPSVDLGKSVDTVQAGGNMIRTVEPALVRSGPDDEVVRIRADR